MGIIDSLARRRTYYRISRQLPVPEDDVIAALRRVVELVPDAYNMRSQRIVIVFGAKHDRLWDAVHDAFEGKVAREKTDSFKAGAGTVLFYTDVDAVKEAQERFPRYADRFGLWSQHAMGMLQLGVWAALRDLGIGASLQHYNPVVDERVAELLGVPGNHRLVAQMPFGGIVGGPDAKEGEDVAKRLRVVR